MVCALKLYMFKCYDADCSKKTHHFYVRKYFYFCFKLLGAMATNVLQVAIENKGISWSIGKWRTLLCLFSLLIILLIHCIVGVCTLYLIISTGKTFH